MPGSLVVLDFSAVGAGTTGRVERQPVVAASAGAVSAKFARAEYGSAASRRACRCWISQDDPSTGSREAPPRPSPGHGAFHLIRRAGVYTASEELELATEPIVTSICGGDEWIETDALLTGLEAGRWLIVSGERADIPGTSGVMASELVMLGAVRNTVEIAPGGGRSDVGARRRRRRARPGAVPAGRHACTPISSSPTPLAYCYKRATRWRSTPTSSRRPTARRAPRRSAAATAAQPLQASR